MYRKEGKETGAKVTIFGIKLASLRSSCQECCIALHIITIIIIPVLSDRQQTAEMAADWFKWFRVG